MQRPLLLPATFSAATQAGPLAGGRVLLLDGDTMGTRWRVQAVVPAPMLAIAAAEWRPRIALRLAALNAELSHWDRQSALCAWNAAPAGRRVTLSPALRAVLRIAARIAAASGGALDVALGALVDLWGFGPPGPRTDGHRPDATALAAARARSGWHRLAFDGERLLQPGGVQLDLSGIAKGYAVDVLSAALAAAGLAHHCVEIGGELRGQGVKPDGQPWWVDLDDGGSLALRPRLALDGLAVATSGDAYRRAVLDGECCAHTLDPATGAPLTAAPTAVSVIAASAAEADGWATALTVLGPVNGLRLADRLGLAVRWRERPGARPIDSAAWTAATDAADDAADDAPAASVQGAW